MVGWCHQLNGHEFEQTPGDGEGQAGLACCSPWGCKELDMTEQLDNTIAATLRNRMDTLSKFFSVVKTVGGTHTWRGYEKFNYVLNRRSLGRARPGSQGGPEWLQSLKKGDMCLSWLGWGWEEGSHMWAGPWLIRAFLWCQQREVVFVHSLLFMPPWAAARQASLFFTISWSLLRHMSFESVMPSNHLIHCHPLLLLPSIFPSIRVFSNKSTLLIRWLKYWSFSFSISPSNQVYFL